MYATGDTFVYISCLREKIGTYVLYIQGTEDPLSILEIFTPDLMESPPFIMH